MQEPTTDYEICPAKGDAKGAVIVKHVDMFGKETEIWIPGNVVNEMVKAVIEDRLQ